MSEGKSINLRKAAKELNIGWSTAVESLGKKGFKVDPKPNTKLTEEMYNALLKEYQGDKIVREEARQIVIGKIRRDDTQPLATERQEPRRNKDFEQDEILIKNTGSFEHHQSTEKAKPVSAPADEPAEGNTEEKQEENALPGVKIVGKIDLDSLNRRLPNEPKKGEGEGKKNRRLRLSQRYSTAKSLLPFLFRLPNQPLLRHPCLCRKKNQSQNQRGNLKCYRNRNLKNPSPKSRSRKCLLSPSRLLRFRRLKKNQRLWSNRRRSSRIK